MAYYTRVLRDSRHTGQEHAIDCSSSHHLYQGLSQVERRDDGGLHQMIDHRVLDGLFTKNYRGLDAENCELTVVITKFTTTDLCWWRETIPALRAKLHGQLSLQFEVLSPGTLRGMKHNAQPMEALSIREESYANAVTMGASVGISGAMNFVRTLGGTIRLSNGHSHGIANYHVVRDDDLNQDSIKLNTLPKRHRDSSILPTYFTSITI
ncbi:hypothetical protein T440DRAFT_509189 [Plenodomus tracheiphilus IPT5]|uniref:Uncharacterized protein n=1 Tax=Plenodomus tracheiphilus IPT5 TaxID=1408161 RepID=A0A6A7AZT4_9PLEO|nr:hypothetical protein T440DRAFT_509189 [Plenodomus tracheiphilus IPT5]